MSNTPYITIDLTKVDHNIQQMIERLRAAGIDHWPHFKTHKSVELAQRQLELGAKGITVAKIAEAEVLAEAGVGPIFIAYSIVGEEKLNRLQTLMQSSHIRTTVDSREVAAGLSAVGERLGSKVEVLIEIDGGSHRGGVQPGPAVLEFARQIHDLPGIEIVGVFAYTGQIYGAASEAEIQQFARGEAAILTEAAQLLREHGFPVTVLSGGSTPSSFYAEHMAGITESRAGNYIFCDMNAVHLGLVQPEDCALRIGCTIISTPLPGRATIDAGTKTITSDLSNRGSTYGYILGKPDVRIVKLNEEHGFLEFDPARHQFNIGDRLEIIPNHSCVIPNLNDAIMGQSGDGVTRSIRIDARGKNY